MNATSETLTAPPAVELRNITLRYRREKALDGFSATFRPGVITGLLGPNASGKSTLAAVLAGFRKHSEGEVFIRGRAPFEDAVCQQGTCLIREAGDAINDEKIERTLRLHAALRPTWDDDLARRFLDRFGVSTRKKPTKLSRGQRSVLGAAIGLASRAPLTIFDEVQLGMDAETRYGFYEELLADYAAHPRTIIIASHLIGELENIIEDVVLIQEGRCIQNSSVEELRSRLLSLVGPVAEVEQLASGRSVVSRQELGPTAQVTLDVADAPLAPSLLAQCPGVQSAPVPLQDAVIHLTARHPRQPVNVEG